MGFSNAEDHQRQPEPKTQQSNNRRQTLGMGGPTDKKVPLDKEFQRMIREKQNQKTKEVLKEEENLDEEEEAILEELERLKREQALIDENERKKKEAAEEEKRRKKEEKERKRREEEEEKKRLAAQKGSYSAEEARKRKMMEDLEKKRKELEEKKRKMAEDEARRKALLENDDKKKDSKRRATAFGALPHGFGDENKRRGSQEEKKMAKEETEREKEKSRRESEEQSYARRDSEREEQRHSEREEVSHTEENQEESEGETEREGVPPQHEELILDDDDEEQESEGADAPEPNQMGIEKEERPSRKPGAPMRSNTTHEGGRDYGFGNKPKNKTEENKRMERDSLEPDPEALKSFNKAHDPSKRAENEGKSSEERRASGNEANRHKPNRENEKSTPQRIETAVFSRPPPQQGASNKEKSESGHGNSHSDKSKRSAESPMTSSRRPGGAGDSKYSPTPSVLSFQSGRNRNAKEENPNDLAKFRKLEEDVRSSEKPSS